MSRYLFYPSLQPKVCHPSWCERKYYNCGEPELLYYEREQQKIAERVKNAAHEILPIGKVHNINANETDDEDANEESEESDSRDEEDDDMNDRQISGQAEHSVLYSPGDDMTPNEEISVTMGENSQ